MKPFPHHYKVTASAFEVSAIELASSGLRSLISASPAEFDGPGSLWSPETFFIGAVSGCFILTFRAIAKASKLSWSSLVCDADGTVDRSEGATSFTAIRTRAKLVIPNAADMEKAKRLLEKTEKSCLIANSLKIVPQLELEIAVEQAA